MLPRPREHRELPSEVRGGAPAENAFWHIFWVTEHFWQKSEQADTFCTQTVGLYNFFEQPINGMSVR